MSVINNNNTNTDTTTYHHVPECNYNPGMNQLTLESVYFLRTFRCLTVYGTDRVIVLDDLVEALEAEIARLNARECPSHLYCGADDAWYESLYAEVDICRSLIEDLRKGEEYLTSSQAGLLYRLFPELQKGIMIEAARREVEYATTHRFYNEVMQEDTNLTAAMRILKDLTLVDDQRPMDRLPTTGDDYDNLIVGEDISYNKSREAFDNLQTAMGNLFRFHVQRDDHRNISW